MSYVLLRRGTHVIQVQNVNTGTQFTISVLCKDNKCANQEIDALIAQLQALGPTLTANRMPSAT